MTTQPHPASLDIVYVEVKERLAAQLQQVETLDSKAGTVLSIASLVMTIAAGLQVSFARGAIESLPLTLLVLGTALYASTAFFGFRGYWVRNFRRDPEPGPLRDRYLFQDVNFTKRRILANMIQSFQINRDLIESKVWNIKVAILSLAAETLALVGALVSERLS